MFMMIALRRRLFGKLTENLFPHSYLLIYSRPNNSNHSSHRTITTTRPKKNKSIKIQKWYGKPILIINRIKPTNLNNRKSLSLLYENQIKIQTFLQFCKENQRRGKLYILHKQTNKPQWIFQENKRIERMVNRGNTQMRQKAITTKMMMITFKLVRTCFVFVLLC